MLIATLLSPLLLLSALWFVSRIYTEIKKQHIIPLQLMTKIGTIHLFALLFLYIYFFKETFVFWFLSFSSLIIFPGIIFCWKKIREQQFYSEFLRMLTLCVLHMQVGKSFLSAFDQTLAEGKWRHHRLMKHIFDNVSFSQQELIVNGGEFDRWLAFSTSELREVRHNQHQAIDRLKHLKNNLRDRVIFRHKSRQIWLYFFYQLSVLSLIFLSLSIYIVNQYGFYAFRHIFALSYFIYGLGVFILSILAKGRKWSI